MLNTVLMSSKCKKTRGMSFWVISVGISFIFLGGQSVAKDYETCADRLHNIQHELELARLSDDDYKSYGLKRALLNVRRYCEDERVEKIHDKAFTESADVAIRGEQMEDALQSGDVLMIESARANLHRAREELRQARKELHE